MKCPVMALRWRRELPDVGSTKLSDYKERRYKRTLTGDEGDELRDTFLHTLFGFLGNLCIVRKSHLHDAGDWSKVSDVSI